ncbi:hypothetical protein BJX70DRAFT_108032 [Aspergillus crustosus]
MIRLVRGVPEQDSEEQTYPEPIPQGNHQHWSTIRSSETLKTINCNPLSYIHALDSSKPWERLKMPILCSICKEQKATWPLLDQVHWKYLHCTECPNIFACGNCLASTEPDTLHTKDHECIVLQTRPFASPTPDGSELQQLQLFKDVQTAGDFFLYFPWFLHCFEGMEEAKHGSREAIFTQMLQGDLHIEEDQMPSWALCLRFPVDWYSRWFGVGNWRALHQSLQSTVDARIQVARGSKMLNELLGRVRGIVDAKERCFGKENIPHRMPSQYEDVVASLVTPEGRDYLRYTFPLQFLTTLDAEINQDKIQDAMQFHAKNPEPNASHNNLQSAGDHYPSEGICRISTSASYNAETERLWPIFKLLFGEFSEFKHLVKPRLL